MLPILQEPAKLPVTRIAIFADVQNIYYTTRQAFGRQFNYQSLWERVSATGEIVAATAYAIDRGDDKQRKFQDALRKHRLLRQTKTLHPAP